MFEFAKYVFEKPLKYDFDDVSDFYQKGFLSVGKVFQHSLKSEYLIMLLRDADKNLNTSDNSFSYGYYWGKRDGIAYWLRYGHPISDEMFSFDVSKFFSKSLVVYRGG